MARFEKFDSRKQIRGLAEAARQILAEELIREQQVPLSDQIIAVIDETRREYRPRTLAARQKTDEKL